jgi:hypothetical protein
MLFDRAAGAMDEKGGGKDSSQKHRSRSNSRKCLSPPA